MPKLVAFRNTLEDNSDIHYGILTDDNTIICLCRMEIVEEDDYEIIEENIELYNTSIDKMLCEEIYDYNEMEDMGE